MTAGAVMGIGFAALALCVCALFVVGYLARHKK